MIFLVAAAAFALALKRISDFDLFWHLAAGRWMWDHHAVLRADPFSYVTEGAPWVSLTWGYEVLCYGMWRVGGYGLVCALHAAAAAGAAALSWKVFERLRVEKFAGGLLFLLGLLLVEPRWSNRPEIFTHLLGAGLLLLLVEYRAGRAGERALIGGAFALQAAWSNLHGAFLLGPMLVGAYAIFEEDAGRRRGLYRALAAAALGCFLQPRGISGVQAAIGLGKALADPTLRNSIAEAQGPLSSPWGIDTFAFLLFALAAPAATLWRRERDSLGPFAIAVGLTVLAWTARRNAALLVLWTLPFFSAAAGEALASTLLFAWMPGPRLSRGLTGLAFASLLLLGFSGIHRPSVKAGAGAELEAMETPEEAAAFLASLPSDGPNPLKTFADEEAADYLLFRVPGFRSFIDTRHAEVQTRDAASRYMGVIQFPPLINQETERAGIRVVFLRYSYWLGRPLLQALARDTKWRLAYLDPLAVVFVDSRLGKGPSAETLATDALARARAGEGLAAQRDPVAALTRLSDFFGMLGLTRLASQAVNAALALKPDDAGVRSSACRLSYIQENPRADDACAVALALGSTEVSVRQTLGLIKLQAGRSEEAAREFDFVVEKDPYSFEGWMARATVYEKLGRIREALDSLRAANGIRPADPTPRLNSARLMGQDVGKKPSS